MSSLDLLAYVIATTHEARLLVLSTLRSAAADTERIARQLADLSRGAGATTIVLGPLSRHDIGSLVSETVDEPLDPALLRQIETLSAGVPLYVEELVAARAASVTGALRLNLSARLTGLSEDTLGFLRASAVGAGHAFTDLVGGVTGLDVPRLAAAELGALARGLIDQGGEHVTFHHPLLRDAVLGSLARSERADLHRRWAEQLEAGRGPLPSRERAMAAATHWYESGDAERGLVASIAAAQAATGMSAVAEA